MRYQNADNSTELHILHFLDFLNASSGHSFGVFEYMPQVLQEKDVNHSIITVLYLKECRQYI